jgi:hypothetical protein
LISRRWRRPSAPLKGLRWSRLSRRASSPPGGGGPAVGPQSAGQKDVAAGVYMTGFLDGFLTGDQGYFEGVMENPSNHRFLNA